MEPAEAGARLREHREILRQHEALDRTVGHLAKSMDGGFIVRGLTEENEVQAYREAKALLPAPHETPPAYYHGDRAYVLHDPRARLIPLLREEQTAMNVAFGVITRNLEAY